MEVPTSLTAIAVTVCVTMSASTRIRCPHGGFLYERAGVWVVNVQPVAPHTTPHRGDVVPCGCARCRGAWYNVVSYERTT